MYRFFVSTFLTLILFSCTPEKKLQRLENKHPYLFTRDTTTQIDTFIRAKIDTLYRDSIIIDTAALFFYDTIYQVTDTANRATTIVRVIKDSLPIIKIKTIVQPDTIIITTYDTLITTRTEIKERITTTKSHFFKKYWLIWLILFTLLLILYLKK